MVTIRIKDNSKQAKAVVELLRTFPFVEVEEQPRYNATTENALKEVKAGKTTKVSLEKFREELYS